MRGMRLAHRLATPRDRETHRVQDIHSGSALLRPLGLCLHESVYPLHPVSDGKELTAL